METTTKSPPPHIGRKIARVPTLKLPPAAIAFGGGLGASVMREMPAVKQGSYDKASAPA